MKAAALLLLSLTALAQYPAEDSYAYYGRGLSPAESRGRNTWYFWTGGGETMWRKITKITGGTVDLLLYAESQPRNQRFKTLGLTNDPDCSASGPDRYGLNLDTCKPLEIPGIPGESTGIIGLRRFPNPDFRADQWNVDEYRKHPDKVEPPYIVGMTCGFCHVGMNPVRPPADPENPRWANLASTAGNQYWKEGKLFSFRLKPDNFFWHAGELQPPGTSDTSRIATDHIYNPNAINTIVLLKHRPVVDENIADFDTGNVVVRKVHHILKAGEDSVGTAFAGLRVYVNIGMCSDQWLALQDPVTGETRNQSPFKVAEARRNCAKWRETEARMPDAEAFLNTMEPPRLKDAPGASTYLSGDASVLNLGKRVFAEQCATCHSSKQPPADIASDPAKRIEWFRNAVMSSDFLDGNFLSDDRRYPVAMIGTNFSRSAGSNAMQGHIWEDFSSIDYKRQRQSEEIKGLYNPIEPKKPISFRLPEGGPGYYRTPTLAGVWATAPYFNNNSLGVFTGDPSVAGRMRAFDDAMDKLLWPEHRLGIKTVLRTTAKSDIIVNGATRYSGVPAGTPIKLFANINTADLNTLERQGWFTKFLNWLLGRHKVDALLLQKNLAPDFVEDHGHTFGAQLQDAEKRALIEYVKTL